MKMIRSILLPLIAVILTIAILWYDHNEPAPVATSSMAQVEDEAAKGGYRLVDVDTLWDWYRTEPGKTFFVDTRQEWEHRAGAIAGGALFSMEPTRWARWWLKDDLETFLGADKTRNLVFY